MPPLLALFSWLVLLVGLLRFDPAQKQKTSLALWVPVIWISIIASRLPSQWLGVGGTDAAQVMQEGNAFDRYVYFALIFLALSILTSRSFGWRQFFAGNIALTSILAFSLLSVAWSDFPFIAFKRWFRDLGTYLAIFVVLTEPNRIESLRTLIRRVCFLLIPLSIVLIKYYPEMAKHYDAWSGQAFFIGVTTSKNMLGVLCLVSGLFFLWDTFTRWSDRQDPQRRRIIWLNAAFFGMTIWLLSMANSATSNVCLAIGGLIIAAAHTKTVRRHPAVLMNSIPVGIGLYVLLEFVLEVDIVGALAEFVGRNPDLTGRTHIWSVVRAAGTNPIIGAGYESFWLGSRLEWVWEQAGHVNEAHNGFLEVYLTLGLIGVALYCALLIASYWAISRQFRSSWSFASLSLALWTVLVFYNVTESAFRGHLMWVAFLLGAIALPISAAASEAEPTRESVTARYNIGRSPSGRIASGKGSSAEGRPTTWHRAQTVGNRTFTQPR